MKNVIKMMGIIGAYILEAIASVASMACLVTLWDECYFEGVSMIVAIAFVLMMMIRRFSELHNRWHELTAEINSSSKGV